LISGLKKYNNVSQRDDKIPIGFFTFHDMLEQQHEDHVKDELKEEYFNGKIKNEDKFIRNGNIMLDATLVFWNGLNESRKTLE